MIRISSMPAMNSHLIAKGTGYSRKQSICHQLCRRRGFNTHVKCHDRGNAFQRPHLPGFDGWKLPTVWKKFAPRKYTGTFKRNLDRLSKHLKYGEVFNFGRGGGVINFEGLEIQEINVEM